MDSPLITEHDLRLLSAGYYIQAGIGAFYTLILLGYAGFASAILGTIAKTANDAGGQNIPPALMSIISVVLAVVILLACIYTLCLFLAGLWIRRRQNVIVIQIVAALNCLAIPYGTVLSIFTFMVLQRPSAKQMFATPGVPPPLPPNPAVP